MKIIDQIIAHKRDEIAFQKQSQPLAALQEMPAYRSPSLSLESAIKGKPISVIAEMKKASPSKGVISDHFDHVAIAKAYQANGASAISIVTDRRYFQGDIQYIQDARSHVSGPILMKDFVLDGYQLHVAKAYGADAVLLIARVLNFVEIRELLSEAKELGLEILCEVHDEEDVKKIPTDIVRLIGVNNRDLGSFHTDIEVSIRLMKYLPEGVVTVSESGISEGADLDRLEEAGFDAVLVGERFMKSTNPGEALASLLESRKKEPSGMNR